MANNYPKVCAQCGAEFTAHHPRAKYCSKQCTWNAYYHRHADRRREQARAWNDAHKEQRREYAKKAYWTERESNLAKSKRYYDEHAEELRAKARERHRKRKEAAPW